MVYIHANGALGQADWFFGTKPKTEQDSATTGQVPVVEQAVPVEQPAPAPVAPAIQETDDEEESEMPSAPPILNTGPKGPPLGLIAGAIGIIALLLIIRIRQKKGKIKSNLGSPTVVVVQQPAKKRRRKKK